MSDHSQAAVMLEKGHTLLQQSLRHFARLCSPKGKIETELIDTCQVQLFELARLAAQISAAEQLQQHASTLAGDARPASRLVAQLAPIYLAETMQAIQRCFQFHEPDFGLPAGSLARLSTDSVACDFMGRWLAAEQIAATGELLLEAGHPGEDNLSGEHAALQAAFRRYAEEKVAPQAEAIHRQDLLIPESMIQELAEMGVFGLSIPEQYDGFADSAHPDHMAMVLVADELSRASVGTAGSLGTRPELLSKALLKGGTPAQKERWLPGIASGEVQTAVAITEPDYGSNVAGITTMARPVTGGWRLNGAKMWCTFAGRANALMVLARTDPDRSLGHRGLSLFIVEKPPFGGHAFEVDNEHGSLTGRAIPTLGYRGMHSFELHFEDYFVPSENLIGGEEGVGQGFYLQMHGFTASRLQTAGRALGVMAAAFAEAFKYAGARLVFDRPLLDYPLTRHKLVKMAAHIQAARRLTYAAARAVDRGEGGLMAAMAKLLTAQYAEQISRDALQLHGGMGYAQEFPISRHFVDARVLSIFEGAEEVLALRVIARNLMSDSLVS